MKNKEIVQSSLYNGKIILSFDPIAHKYTLEGKKIDGVTTILKTINKPALIGWAVRTDMETLKESLLRSPRITSQDLDDLIKVASNKHENIKNVSAEFGTNVHACIESFIKTGNPFPIPVTPEEADVVLLFEEWAKENVSKFVDSEKVVYSRKYKYCGTLDFTCFMKDGGGLFVGDIKTTGHIYPEYMLQTAAYELAYREETGLNIEGRVIVRLKDGQIETKLTRDKKKDIEAFKAVLKLYRRLNKLTLENYK